MTNSPKTQEPHHGARARFAALMRLLDDASPVVREAVSREILAYGDALAEELRLLPFPPDGEQWALLRSLSMPHYRAALRRHWAEWRDGPDDCARLEAALSLLSRFVDGPRTRAPLGAALDALAAEFAASGAPRAAEELALFLFQDKGFQGVRHDSALPEHGSLAAVLEEGRGLGVMLVCLYVLAGARLGLDIRACNWPGCTLARFFGEDGGMLIVDCMSGGRPMSAETFLTMQGPSREAAGAMLAFEANTAELIMECLSSLGRAYTRAGGHDEARLMDQLRDGLIVRAGVNEF